MFTQAASRASTTARAMRFASAVLPHVTRITNLSVKFPSEAVTLSRKRDFRLSQLCMTGYNTRPKAKIFFKKMTAKIKFGTSGWRAIIADDFTFANLRLATAAIAE